MKLDLEQIKKIFAAENLAALLGYRRGLSFYSTIPCVFKKTGELDGLVFDYFADDNLATYLLDLLAMTDNRPVGILVKPCDGKALLELLREKQFKDERVTVFSLPCQGIINKNKLFALKNCQTEPIKEVKIAGNQVTIDFGERKIEQALSSLVENKCLRCNLKESPLYDYVLGEATASQANQPQLKPQKFDRQYWLEQYAKCLRCNACRNVCPLCYCQDCSLDQTEAKILSKEASAAENGFFLMTRAMHLAGRCVDCGRCAEVCPVLIDHENLHLPLAAFVAKAFDFEPGRDLGKPSVFSEAKMTEKEGQKT